MGKNVSDALPIQNGLEKKKKRDALSPLLFNVASERPKKIGNEWI
jgi:hypothetical protein